MDKNTQVPPKIIITGPSPMVRTPSTMTIASTSYRNFELDETATDTDSMVMTADEIAEQLANDSIDQCGPVLEVHPCDVAIRGVYDSQDLSRIEEGSGTSQSEPTSLRNTSLSVWEKFRRFYYQCSEATESKLAILFWLLLMPLPISSGFMGARYLDECTLSPSAPALLFMMGITGIIMITIRIMIILYSSVCDAENDLPCLHTTVVITYIITLVLFVTEMMAFWRYSPSFDIISPDYCNPNFYNFTFWMNCVAIAVMSVVFIIRIPICFFGAQRTD